MVYRTVLVEFSATHKLFNPSWSQAENQAVFGPCANVNWHGHNFKLYITLKANALSTGFPLDEVAFLETVNEELLAKIDGKNLSVGNPFMENEPATCEYIVQRMWRVIVSLLKQGFPLVSLHLLKLYETKNNAVEYSEDEEFLLSTPMVTH